MLLLRILLCIMALCTAAEDGCVDTYQPRQNCTSWAAAGECQNNPRFMAAQCNASCDCRFDDECKDLHEEKECDAWREAGECEYNPHFMHTNCRFACGCPPKCTDTLDECAFWAAAGECTANAAFMSHKCRFSCGCKKPCANRESEANCTAWRQAGECTANPAFMSTKCALTCGTCSQFDYGTRCPQPPREEAAVPPGAVQDTLLRAVTDFPELEPELLSDEPPVVLFNKFLQPDEMEALLAHGEGRYERAQASGGRKEDEFVGVVSEIRTAWNTWCNETCWADERVVRLTQRMEAVARVPANNSELIQLLRYMPCPEGDPEHAECQFYRRHHDYIPEMRSMSPGPRVYTFFLYLSDVEEGGGTKFDGGFTVQPAAGRAVLWPSVFDHDTFAKDDRTHHEALPVLKGIKYAANYWLHQYDFRTAHFTGCTQ